MFEIKGKNTNAKIMIDNVEESCISQIYQMVNHEAFTNQVVIMPDCHSGKGSVIGFTMPIGDKVIPNVVGVDLSCGMLSYNVGKINIDHENIDQKIREMIPFGININKKGKIRLNKNVQDLCRRINVDFEYVVKSLGTVGSGNHFIEIGRSQQTDNIWVTVHSGSRHLGKKVCEYWQEIACKKDYKDPKEVLKEIKELYSKNEWEIRIKKYKEEVKKLIPSELDYLEGKNKDGYIEDMKYCYEYAQVNRLLIMSEILNILNNPSVEESIETVHNYIDFKDNIIRKGAIRSYIGEKIIIPFNMRDGILICEGKSNSEWNYSAPHGAGRVLSRSKAKEVLNIEEFKMEMENIFSTSINYGTIDESPMAYKDSSIIEKAIEPTCKILDRIKPIHNLKDCSDEKPWMKRKIIDERKKNIF